MISESSKASASIYFCRTSLYLALALPAQAFVGSSELRNSVYIAALLMMAFISRQSGSSNNFWIPSALLRVPLYDSIVGISSSTLFMSASKASSSAKRSVRSHFVGRSPSTSSCAHLSSLPDFLFCSPHRPSIPSYRLPAETPSTLILPSLSTASCAEHPLVIIIVTASIIAIILLFIPDTSHENFICFIIIQNDIFIFLRQHILRSSGEFYGFPHFTPLEQKHNSHHLGPICS